jgi:hypothetical protein
MEKRITDIQQEIAEPDEIVISMSELEESTRPDRATESAESSRSNPMTGLAESTGSNPATGSTPSTHSTPALDLSETIRSAPATDSTPSTQSTLVNNIGSSKLAQETEISDDPEDVVIPIQVIKSPEGGEAKGFINGGWRSRYTVLRRGPLSASRYELVKGKDVEDYIDINTANLHDHRFVPIKANKKVIIVL